MGQIVVAFEGEKTLYKMCEILESAGLRIAAACSTGAEVLRSVRKAEIDLVFCGFKLRDTTGEALFDDLPGDVGMLMLAPQGQLDCVENDTIVKLAAPVKRSELVTAVSSLQQLRQAQVKPVGRQRSDEERAVIAQAKELLMARCAMTEDQAHHFLQKYSMDTGSRLVVTARRVLEDVTSVVPAAMLRQ